MVLMGVVEKEGYVFMVIIEVSHLANLSRYRCPRDSLLACNA